MSELPKGWEAPGLAEICDFNPKHDPDTDREQLVSFVPMPAVSDETGTIETPQDRPLSEIWKGYTHFQNGDVIFAKITPCMENGKSAVAVDLTNGLACGSTEFHVLRPRGGVLPDYIWKFVRQVEFRRDAEAHMTGAVGQRRVPKPYLEKHPIPLPPLSEQRRIVRKLDTLSARTTTARSHLSAIAKLVERYKAGFQEAALKGSLHLHGFSTPFEEWKTSSGSELFDWSSGSGLTKKQQLGGDIPVYGGNGIGGYHNEALIDFSTIVIGRVGAQCGNIHMTNGPSWVTDNAIYAKSISKEIHLGFARFVLDAEGLNEAAGGSGQPYVSQKTLNAVDFRFPPLSEQIEIIRRIEAAFAKIDRLAAEAEKALKLTNQLDQRILAKAFAGELVSQDPTDEPAGVLLERIRAERASAPKPKRGRRKKTEIAT